MNRFFIEISYNGTDFFGWQRQPRQISVQQVIEEALSKIHSNQEISIVGCGRTDTGVHAKQYFFHVDLDEKVVDEQFVFKLNRMLPNSIVVHNLEKLASEKHARFDAKMRTYRYFIHQKKNAFVNDFSWFMPLELDIAKMNEACQFLIGKMDFTSLSKLHTDVKTNICHVHAANWIEEEKGLFFEIKADRFLRNMVRATVGTLVDVGNGKINPDDVQHIINAKDRQAASMSVPAHGLFLWEIEY